MNNIENMLLKFWKNEGACSVVKDSCHNISASTLGGVVITTLFQDWILKPLFSKLEENIVYYIDDLLENSN